MDSTLLPLIDTLDDNIDDLEEIFSPLLKTALGDTVQKLPLLDKAQFYILITYSIESTLFCKLGFWQSSRHLERESFFSFFVTLLTCLVFFFLYLAYLRLHGVGAKEHPVFRELTRVKQYFEKINKALESREGGDTTAAAAARSSKLDKAAANRFIRHALVSEKN